MRRSISGGKEEDESSCTGVDLQFPRVPHESLFISGQRTGLGTELGVTTLESWVGNRSLLE